MSLIRTAIAAVALTFTATGAAQAAASVDWVDWTTVNVSQQVLGTIANGADTVGVTFTGPRQFAQVTGAGTDNWAEPATDPYTGGVVNRPPTSDIIALGTGGTKTVTFSHAVKDPYLALLNWDGVSTVFSAPVSLVSEGCGISGCGSFTISADGLTLNGVGHATGVLRLKGTFDTLTFTDSTSAGIVRGFRVGLADPAAAPEPAAWALMILGFGAAGAALRRTRTATA